MSMSDNVQMQQSRDDRTSRAEVITGCNQGNQKEKIEGRGFGRAMNRQQEQSKNRDRRGGQIAGRRSQTSARGEGLEPCRVRRGSVEPLATTPIHLPKPRESRTSVYHRLRVLRRAPRGVRADRRL